MKTVYINGRFLCKKITGVERFAIEITKELDKLEQNDIEFKIIAPSKEYVISDISFSNIQTIYLKGKPNYYWEQIKLANYCKKHKPYDLLNLCNVAPIRFPGSCVVHDLGFIDAKQGYSWKQRFVYKLINRLNIKKYKHIFTISNIMRKRIEEYYSVNNVSVVYNAANHMKDLIPSKPKIDLPKEFYFSLGSMNPNKNFKSIIEIAKNYKNDYFIISGKKHKSFKDETYDIPSNVIFAGYLSDNEICYMYKSCKAFLFPSVYEGFGIPPLEALVCGCKNVICNDIPVLHEIYDGMCNFVDFNDSDIMLDNLKNDCVYKEKYSWYTSANIIIEQYKG